jgi:pyruvate/2-oxoglutarate dehydrogenase complex dihydrolipoamide acyltransferase (E2) component
MMMKIKRFSFANPVETVDEGPQLAVYAKTQAQANAGLGHGKLPSVYTESIDVDATDAAAELAVEEGVDLTEIYGTGSGGRVLKSDVEKVIDELQVESVQESLPDRRTDTDPE